MRALLELYDMPESQRSQLLELVALSSDAEWWETYSDTIADGYASFLGFESGAAERWEWQALVIPGSLQTENYARAVVGGGYFGELTPRQIRRRIDLRMARYNRLINDPLVDSRVIIDESVLLRKMGDRTIMSEQLNHLRELAEHPQIHLQVLLHDQGLVAPVPSFILLRFSTLDGLGELYPDVVYLEDAAGGYLDEDELLTHRYLVLFNRISEVALSSEESMRFVEERAKRWAQAA
ncbi:DUF5753 domain-containing protein [Actinomadura sp. ATCC 31491]|uniref:DUF5753 domain-containing protein n=1 Tax=Actinomadura luzonensis TaxID=2805427 RepID=A0ABT0G632_9ACTN|nr:DUF5753 domain-containing protein [Actinomadura luzonensis]